MKHSTRLKTALMQRRALTVPGCHDALSAKIVAHCGFEAIQISGFGLSGCLIGKPDLGLVAFKDILDMTWNIVQAVDIPVMADIDTGGGNAINAALATERLIAMGVAGMNIEDQIFPKRCGHMKGKEVISAEEMVGKVRACAEVRDRIDPDFIINARSDAYAVHGLEETLRRCNLYLDAGADMVFIDGIQSKKEIETAIGTIHGLLSVNLMDAVSGVRTELIPIPELAAMGIARVSIPVASILVAHKALTDFFTALKQSPNGILLGQTQWLSSFTDYNLFTGMEEYREMEKKYLPARTLQEKYS